MAIQNQYKSNYMLQGLCILIVRRERVRDKLIINLFNCMKSINFVLYGLVVSFYDLLHRSPLALCFYNYQIIDDT